MLGAILNIIHSCLKLKMILKKTQKYILSFSPSLPTLIFVPLPLLILCPLKASAEPQSGDGSQGNGNV